MKFHDVQYAYARKYKKNSCEYYKRVQGTTQFDFYRATLMQMHFCHSAYAFICLSVSILLTPLLMTELISTPFYQEHSQRGGLYAITAVTFPT